MFICTIHTIVRDFQVFREQALVLEEVCRLVRRQGLEEEERRHRQDRLKSDPTAKSITICSRPGSHQRMSFPVYVRLA